MGHCVFIIALISTVLMRQPSALGEASPRAHAAASNQKDSTANVIGDCSPGFFSEKYEPYRLLDAYSNAMTHRWNNTRWPWQSAKPVPNPARPYPLLEAKSVGRTESYVPLTTSKNPAYQPQTRFVLEGWRYGFASDSNYRMALAEAMLCEMDKKDAFGDVLRGWLNNNKIFEMYLSIDGKSEKRAPEDAELIKAKFYLENFDELRSQARTATGMSRAFLRALFQQIQQNEENIHKEKPFFLTRDFQDQISLLQTLRKQKRENPESLTPEERAFLEYFEQISQEPRFSYLVHPLIAAIVHSDVPLDARAQAAGRVNGEQLRDFEYQMKRILGDSLSLTKIIDARFSQGYLDTKEGKVFLKVPDLENVISESLQKPFMDIINSHSGRAPYEKKQLMHAMKDRMLALMNTYDHSDFRASPELQAARRAAVRAVANFTEDQEGNTAFARRSVLDPDGARATLDLLSSISKNANLTYEPGAAENLYHLDPVWRDVLQAINDLAGSLGNEEKALLQDFLDTGASTKLMAAITPSIFNPRIAKKVGDTLLALGADKEAHQLLSQLDINGRYRERQNQAQQYEATRTRLKAALLSKPAHELTTADKANLITLAILDEVGLKGVTPRDKPVDTVGGNYYDVDSLHAQLAKEAEELNRLAAIQSIPVSELEKQIIAHARQSTGDSGSGLTPQIRRTIAQRLAGEEGLPAHERQQLLTQAKSHLDSVPRGLIASRKRAEDSLNQMVYKPMDGNTVVRSLVAQAGQNAALFILGNQESVLSTKMVEELSKAGFWDFEKLKALIDAYSKYDQNVDLHRLALAKTLLDFTRAKIVEKTAASKFYPEDADKHLAEAELLQPLATLLQQMVFMPQHRKHIEDILNYFLGNTGENDLPFIMPVVQALASLKNQGAENFILNTKNVETLDALIYEHTGWDKTIKAAFPNISQDGVIYANQFLGQLSGYSKAITEIEQAAIRNPQSTLPGEWRNQARNNLETRLTPSPAEGTIDGSSHGLVAGLLTRMLPNIEATALKKARNAHIKFQAAVKELTDRKGAFKNNFLHYDPVENIFVITDNTVLDEALRAKLRELGPVNLEIRLDRDTRISTVWGNGYEGLEEHLANLRFAHGYYEPSTTYEDESWEGTPELPLPFSESTAVKVIRKPDGTYEYKFRNAHEIRSELEKNKKILQERRKQYSDAIKDYGSFGHAAKAYFGAIVWLDPNNTSQSKELQKSYNDLMGLLRKLEEDTGHVKDSKGMSGVQISALNRNEVIWNKLQEEKQEIEKFVDKVEVIHDITTILVTLPVSQLAMLKALKGAKYLRTSHRLMARMLLQTARAARAYHTATRSAALSGLVFTGIGQTFKAGGTAIDYFVGEGPRLIREKIELYERLQKEGGKKPWRKYASMPKPNFRGEPSAAELEKYRRAVFEYQIEEQLDPDHDGIPNNHDFMETTFNGTETIEDMIWSPVEMYAGNLKFFQGLNVAKSLPLVARGNLPGEMAFASLWTMFHPNDPSNWKGLINPTIPHAFEKVRRLEQKRLEMELGKAQEGDKTADTRQRSVLEIASKEAGLGAVEGFRFGLASYVPKGVMRWDRFPRGRAGVVLGTASFVLADYTLKQAVHSAETGKVELPWTSDPKWVEHLVDSTVTSAYIGRSIAQGGQVQEQHRQLKEKYLGISTKNKAPGALADKPVKTLIEKEFGGNEAAALVFLRTALNPNEIGKAPEKVQKDYFEVMAAQNLKAVEDLREFARNSNNEALKKEAEILAETISEIQTISQNGTTRGLSPQDANRLNDLRLQQDVSLQVLMQELSVRQERLAKAQSQMAWRNGRVTSRVFSQAQRQAAQTEFEAAKALQQDVSLINSAVQRLATQDIYNQQLQAPTAVLSPSSKMAENYFDKHPKALAALKRAEKEWAGEDAFRSFMHKLMDNHVVPDVRRGGTLWTGPHGYDGVMQEASKRLQKVRDASKDPAEKAELLDVLRIVDPEKAIAIEKREPRQ